MVQLRLRIPGIGQILPELSLLDVQRSGNYGPEPSPPGFGRVSIIAARLQLGMVASATPRALEEESGIFFTSAIVGAGITERIAGPEIPSRASPNWSSLEAP